MDGFGEKVSSPIRIRMRDHSVASRYPHHATKAYQDDDIGCHCASRESLWEMEFGCAYS
jgi:hypothetical protein